MLELVVSAADYKLGKEAGRRGGRGGRGGGAVYKQQVSMKCLYTIRLPLVIEMT